MKKITFYINTMLFIVVVLITINTFDLPGNGLIKVVLAHSGIGFEGTGGTVNYLARFAGAANPSTTIGDSVIYQDIAGNVGIGTTAPTAKLEISSGGTPWAAPADTLLFLYRNGVLPADLVFANQANGYTIRYRGDVTVNDRLEFVDGGGVVDMVIKNGGNVGIGMTAPQAKLDIDGAIRLAPGAPTGTLVNGMMWMVP